MATFPNLFTILNGAAVITTSTAPTMGNINTYNTSGGALTVTLPALSGLNMTAGCIIEKYTLDGTLNPLTINTTSGDTFDDGTTQLILVLPGEKVQLQLISVSGTVHWKVNTGWQRKSGLTAATAETTVTNTTAATNVTPSFTLPAASLAAGSTFRTLINGSVQVQATSGPLTFTPFLQGTALNTFQMPSQASAAGPVGFRMEIITTVRSTGSSGTAISHGHGWVNFATPLMITTTNTAATTINTTSGASSTALYAQAQWATASATNTLKIETATIERVV